MHDPRTDEAIDALLAGRARRRGRPSRLPVPVDASQPFEGLINRVAWTEAVANESARLRRYGHAASVVAFDLVALGPIDQREGWLDRLSGPIAHAIRRGARETDLVARASPGRFLVLLPETTETEASLFADRVLRDCRIWLDAMAAPVGIRASAAAALGDGELEDALARALDLLGGA